MDASPIHTYKDTTPRTDITCKETHSPGQINDKKRKRQNDHDHEHTLNPFFRPFHATVSLNNGKSHVRYADSSPLSCTHKRQGNHILSSQSPNYRERTYH
jgi:hypothetical protein